MKFWKRTLRVIVRDKKLIRNLEKTISRKNEELSRFRAINSGSLNMIYNPNGENLCLQFNECIYVQGKPTNILAFQVGGIMVVNEIDVDWEYYHTAIAPMVKKSNLLR